MKIYSLLALLMVSSAASSAVQTQVEVDKDCQLEYSRYQATVTGYCQEQRAELAQKIPLIEKKITIKPADQIPEYFWYSQKMHYSLVKQENASAPLVFVIAGTGASHDSAKMQVLQKTLYGQGYHVISIASPTFPNYIVAAAGEGEIIGDLNKDAKNLHKIMQKVLAAVKADEGIAPTSFSLTGYSLGGAHSAYVAKVDDTEKVFNFEKIVLINPPANLYNSVGILDGYLDLKNKGPQAKAMLNNIFERFAEVYASQDSSELNAHAIFDLFQGAKLTAEELELLIGLSFRLSSTDMMFAIDVIHNVGALTYKNHTIKKFESVTDALIRGNQITFADYFKHAVVPWTQEKEPDVTLESMVERLSLKHIEDFIRSNERMSMVTNADDIILKEGEVEYLTNLFGDRAHIFARGGHCGNMDRVSFVDYMKSQFNGASL